MHINIFLPFLSDSLPMIGMNIEREMEKPEKIIPNQIPVAPKFWA